MVKQEELQRLCRLGGGKVHQERGLCKKGSNARGAEREGKKEKETAESP